MNTAISEMLIDSTVKPTSLAPLSGRLERRHARFDVAGDVLQHDDGIVDDEAGRDRQRHQRQIVEAVAQQVHRARTCAISDTDTATTGISVARALRRKANTTTITRDNGDHQRPLDVAAARRGSWSSGRPRQSMSIAGETEALQLRHQRLHAIDGLDDVGAGLAVEDHQDRRLAVGKAGVAQILDRVRRPRRRRTAAPARRCDRRSTSDLYSVGLVRLVVGVDLIALVADVDAAFRAVRVGAGERRAHVLEPDAVFVERLRD